MTYTGDVTPGGPADTREAGDLLITKVAVDPEMSNNCYLLRCVSTGDQVLIDAAAEPSTLLPLIGDAGLTHVVTTHQHWDHHRALPDVVAATGAEVVAGAPDAEAITEQTGVAVTRTVDDGDTIPVGSCSLRVIRLTGHTPGSIALLYDDGSGAAAPVHRRLALPGRRRQHPRRRRQLPYPARRRRGQALRHPARRDVVLPRPRQRLDPRRRAAAPRRVARAGLVTRAARCVLAGPVA